MTSALYVYVSESVARVLTRDASHPRCDRFCLFDSCNEISSVYDGLYLPEMILVKYVVLRSAYDYHVESGTDIGASEEEIFGRDVRGPVPMFWEGPGTPPFVDFPKVWIQRDSLVPRGYVDYVDPAVIPAAEPPDSMVVHLPSFWR